MDEDVLFDDYESNEEQEADEGVIYRTYRMDIHNKRIIGMTDGLEAAKQNLLKAIQTRRYAYQIYDDQYGCDVLNKIGNTDLSPGYFESDIPAMLVDAFSNMDEVIEIEDIKFDMYKGDSVYISFIAATIFGDTIVEGDVDG